MVPLMRGGLGLAVFVKAPRLGTVKTRLAAKVGRHRALAIHKELQLATLKLAERAPVAQRWLWYGGSVFDPGLAPNTHWRKRRQRGANLGSRMQHALAEMLRDHARVILIGGDCPTLSLDLLNDLGDALEVADCSFVAAADGGYAGVGVRQMVPGLFHAITWGGADVLSTSLKRARQLALRAEVVGTVRDVDRWEDYQAWRAQCREAH